MTDALRGRLERLVRPVDSAGLAAFRVLFGLTMAFGSARFLWNGWVDRFFGRPDFYFQYWGFEWVTPLGAEATTWAFVALVVLSLMVAAGAFYRVAIIAFALLFTYVELIDVTNYLNHYYFVSLTAVIMAFLPANSRWSVDAMLRPAIRSETVPGLAYGWLRFQVAVVWLGAALAKFTPDWLLGAQPLNIWLNARVDTPIIGPWLDVWEVALLASWAGFLYDASIPFLLMWKKSRPFAFVAVLGFHFMTHVWFTIGMFPLIMVVSATVFFDPTWPSRLWNRVRRTRADVPPPVKSSGPMSPRMRLALLGVALWCGIQLIMPLRSFAYGGDVNWHEQGMRWAWKVMCREKNGTVSFHVKLPDEGRTTVVQPSRYLTDHQEREMSGQPDMILRLAHHVADEWRAGGHENVEVYAETLASLNGRRPVPLIDPEVDLTTVPDGLAAADWITPAPAGPPPRIGRQWSATPSILAWK